MELNYFVQYGAVAGVCLALWQAWQERTRNKRERQRDRDSQTKWRTEADIKLESIDVNWKPQVNARLNALDSRMLNLEQELMETSKSILAEIRKVNDNLNALDKNVALAVQARETLESRFEKLESKES